MCACRANCVFNVTRSTQGHEQELRGYFVTWDFGDCVSWDRSGHPEIFRSCTLHYIYVL